MSTLFTKRQVEKSARNNNFIYNYIAKLYSSAMIKDKFNVTWVKGQMSARKNPQTLCKESPSTEVL